MDDAYVIDLLVHKGVLTDAEASRAKNMQIDTPDRPIVECLVELEILEENDFYELIAQEYGMSNAFLMYNLSCLEYIHLIRFSKNQPFGRCLGSVVK